MVKSININQYTLYYIYCTHIFPFLKRIYACKVTLLFGKIFVFLHCLPSRRICVFSNILTKKICVFSNIFTKKICVYS